MNFNFSSAYNMLEVSFIKTKIKSLIAFPLASLAVGGLAALITKDSMDIYEKLRTPPLSPPSWLFPVAWTVLYILMGIGAALVYNDPLTVGSEKKPAFTLFAFNLVFNFVWTILFFNANAYFVSFAWLLILLCIIIAMTVYFYRVNKLAGLLQIPYILWVAFAGYLNLGIALMNK